MFYFSHVCDCKIQVKSGDGYSFFSISPSICQMEWDRALEKGGKNRGGKASKYNQDCLCQWALQKDSVFIWLSQRVGLQCSLALHPSLFIFEKLGVFFKALNI